MTFRHASTPTRCALASIAATVLLAGCGSDGGSPNDGSNTVPVQSGETLPDVVTDDEEPAVADSGTINVRLEEIDVIFSEGFEVGLRFETPDGEVLASTLWSDFVAAQGDAGPNAFYDSVLEQAVPAGDVVVFGTVNVGIGPPPEVPDLDSDLGCRLPVNVPVDGSVGVTVLFSGDDDCLEGG